MSYRCEDCKEVFDEAKKVAGFTEQIIELQCPNCEGIDLTAVQECERTGCGGYALNGDRYCYECRLEIGRGYEEWVDRRICAGFSLDGVEDEVVWILENGR